MAKGKRDYWDLAGWCFALLLSAGNIGDQLDGIGRSNLQLAIWSGLAVWSVVNIVRAFWPRTAKGDRPATD